MWLNHYEANKINVILVSQAPDSDKSQPSYGCLTHGRDSTSLCSKRDPKASLFFSFGIPLGNTAYDESPNKDSWSNDGDTA
jgi:hypothetical protein